MVSVRVRTAAGWSKISARARYKFVGVPNVTTLSPANGSFAGGQRVTLTGKNLSRTTKVTFGSLRATILSKAPSLVIVRTPAGVLGRGAVKVTSPGGTSRAAAFTYTTPARRSATTVTPGAGTLVAQTVEWVSGGDDPSTSQVEPWLVGLPSGSSVPTVGTDFLVRPGTAVFPSGSPAR